MYNKDLVSSSIQQIQSRFSGRGCLAHTPEASNARIVTSIFLWLSTLK